MSEHAIERARERYGLELTADHIRRMERWVAEGGPRAIMLARCPGEEFWAIRHRQSDPRPLWLATLVVQGRIVTFYPRSYLRNYSHAISNHEMRLARKLYGNPRKDAHAG